MDKFLWAIKIGVMCNFILITPVWAWDFSGYVGLESLAFINKPLYSGQHQQYISGVVEAELSHDWDNGDQLIAFVPFFRGSEFDSRRTHFDIRELTYVRTSDNWELRLGIRKEFWGVTETKHLVDIINQRDRVENLDGEDKLGQPMINFAWIQDWGTLDFYLLPGFRERTFTGTQGRIRPNPAVNTGLAQFDKNGFQRQMAYAVRWSQSVAEWDIGVAHFYGTSRALLFKIQPNIRGTFDIVPYYETINQSSVDVQATYDSWLWKLEAIVRVSALEATFASVAGFEYTFFDVFNTGLDIGVLSEYLYDSRGRHAPNLFADDFFIGARFALNDIQDTQILAGVIVDRTTQAQFYNIEASRRLFDNFKIELEARFFDRANAPANDAISFLRKDSHIRTELSYHF